MLATITEDPILESIEAIEDGGSAPADENELVSSPTKTSQRNTSILRKVNPRTLYNHFKRPSYYNPNKKMAAWNKKRLNKMPRQTKVRNVQFKKRFLKSSSKFYITPANGKSFRAMPKVLKKTLPKSNESSEKIPCPEEQDIGKKSQEGVFSGGKVLGKQRSASLPEFGLSNVTPIKLSPRRSLPYFPRTGGPRRNLPPKRIPYHQALIDACIYMKDVFIEIGLSSPKISSVFNTVAAECPWEENIGASIAPVVFQTAAFAMNSMNYSTQLANRLMRTPFSRSELEERLEPLWKAINIIITVCIVLGSTCKKIELQYADFMKKTGKVHLKHRRKYFIVLKLLASASKKLNQQVLNLTIAYNNLKTAQDNFKLAVRGIGYDTLIVFAMEGNFFKSRSEKVSDELENDDSNMGPFRRIMSSVRKTFTDVRKIFTSS